jgi:hypothetical protein
VLISGYSYCRRCSAKRDRGEIERWAIEVVRSGNGNLANLLKELFGTSDYTFSAFRNLYDRWPRGRWDEKRGFQIEQKSYFQNCLKDFLSKRRKENELLT